MKIVNNNDSNHTHDLRHYFLKFYWLIWLPRLIFLASLASCALIYSTHLTVIKIAFISLTVIAFCSFCLYVTLLIIAITANKENYRTLYKSRWQHWKIKRKFGQIEIEYKEHNGKQVKSVIPAKRLFNHSINRIIVDVRKNKIILIVPVPKYQDIDEQIEKLLPAIHKHISNDYLDFTFRPFERNGNKYWICKGTRKK